MINRIVKSFQFRKRWAEIGVFYLKSKSFSIENIKISGKKIQMSIPAGEEAVMAHEFGTIFYHDCYRLRQRKDDNNVKYILDIGANIGFFSIVARHYFPHAKIYSYEPNQELIKHLENNVGRLDISVHPVAVGARDGSVNLLMGENSLHSKSSEASGGDVQMKAFDSVVKEISGPIDILKLDCEGAEWEILESSQELNHVKFITMEFHLWARIGSSLDDIVKLLGSRGFKPTSISYEPAKSWGLIQAEKI